MLLARTISAEGRSRAFVGGASVPVSTLASVTEPLVAVHGQSDQHRLLKPQAQREALDRFGGAAVDDLATTYARVHADLAASRARARRADHLGARAGPGGRPAAVRARRDRGRLAAVGGGRRPGGGGGRLGHADTLRTAAEQAREALSSEEGRPDALATTAAARTQLESVREHDPEAGELADRLAELTYLLSDLAADVASYASGLETDPHRLAVVSERRAALTALTRKYGDTIDEVLAWAESSAARLGGLDHADDRIEELRRRRDAAAHRARRPWAPASRPPGPRRPSGWPAPSSRSSGRWRCRTPGSQVAVTQREVPADDTTARVLDVDGRRLRYAASGLDEVELLLAANTGAEPRPLHKGASGGELSRVMLALEVALAGTSPVPTFVFDEVDAGVGGKAAIEVGARLARLARTAQVLVVTHLPQVAAYADRHVVVEKSSDGSVTTSGLTVLDDGERVRELSRMLAGVEESDSGLAHARELLDAARSTPLSRTPPPGESCPARRRRSADRIGRS